jgi:hypothetical protein
MNDESTAQPPDAVTWEEPRGPHFPDALSRVPQLAWIFIIVAVARLWMLVDTARLGPAPDPLLTGGVVTHAISSLAVLLAPAALFIRLPDALRSVRILAFGLIAVAVAEVFQALGPGLQPFFDSVVADGSAPVGPLFLAFTAVGALVELIGLVGIGIGFDRARRRPSPGDSGWTKVVLLFAGFLVVTRLAESASLVPGPTDSIAYTMYFWAATGIGVGTIIAWAYLVIVTIRGVTAGEQPTSAWGLGTLAGVMALLAYVLFTVMAVFVTPNVNLNGLLFLASGLFAVGPASLLLAVAAGLPSLGPATKIGEI